MDAPIHRVLSGVSNFPAKELRNALHGIHVRGRAIDSDVQAVCDVADCPSTIILILVDLPLVECESGIINASRGTKLTC